MSRVIDTSQWITFFSKAGLPANVAANYALIFSDNRIQLDMLLDLSKEYLYDMGIKIMGDVIAILRYAKEFHTQLSKERMFGGSKMVTPNKTAVAERMVGHYTRRFAPVQPPPIHSRLTPPQKPNLISLKRKNTEDTVVKKARRVPAEEEGAYKIKMPSGTTAKTRQILQQQQKLPLGAKRSVFSRLGDSAVSSSTDTAKSAVKTNASSVFERLGPNKMSSDEIPTSTVFSDIDLQKRNTPLPYKGVLKMTVGKKRTVVSTSPMKGNVRARTVIKPRQEKLPNINITKTIRINQINSILATRKESAQTLKRLGAGSKSQGLFGGAISHRLGVKGRLGGQVSNSNARNKILLSKVKLPKKGSSNVFDRLGR
ncbi:uncharacterized protein C19orf47 isoform X1 [Parasteatoda tepidariorum]|uniref:uncharacterized protein C19orf47 isoform X1 n=1 Tax=Parasteatoda tepidariorum TaxID=114398 RepID=UPI00077FA05C|nr:uncharacterized protein C19orf47 [Parasteatoda tepidariorum]